MSMSCQCFIFESAHVGSKISPTSTSLLTNQKPRPHGIPKKKFYQNNHVAEVKIWID